MTDYELKSLVNNWVAYYHDRKDDAKWQAWAATNEHLDYLIEYEPWDAWRLLTGIHTRDQSNTINQSLCGPLESLLTAQGFLLIDTVALYARKNPTFTTLLRAIWRGSIDDEVWARIQAIRERRAWTGIPDP